MLLIELSQEQVDSHCNYFMEELDSIISDQNHPWKYTDEDEICQIINCIFKKTHLKLQLSWDGMGFILNIPHFHCMDPYQQQIGIVKYDQDISKLKAVTKVFRRIYRRKRRYEHHWKQEMVSSREQHTLQKP